MTTTAPQQRELIAGEAANVAIDFRGKLDTGETITGSVSVSEVTTDQLAITSAQANGTSVSINGEAVGAGLAVQCRVDTAGATPGTYTLEASAATSAGQLRIGRTKLQVVA